MKYLILGAGWYGCYLGMIFKILGIEFLILEKDKDIFGGSSSKNQNRLHQGFHYPRSKATRDECIKGEKLFNKLFGFMTIGVTNNYYLIDINSKVPYNEYVNIYKTEGQTFTEMHDLYDIDMDMKKISGIIRCNEKVIKHKKAYEFFKNFLKGSIIFNYDVSKLSYKDKIIYDNKEYDYLINCTYGQALRETFTNVNNIEYELCVSYVYESLKNSMTDHSITVMDGKYFSIYPYDSDKNNKFTLTDVEHTPMFKSSDLNKVIDFEKKLNSNHINIVRSKMEKKVKEYMPKFNEFYKYESHYISYKCKFANELDDRSLKVIENKKVINFIGGKITGVFTMVEILFNKIKDLNELNKKYLNKNKDTTKQILNLFSNFRKINQAEIDHHSGNPKNYKHILEFVYEIIHCEEFTYRYIIPVIRIAVCFFGFTRDMERNFKTHGNLFKLHPDIFIHTFSSSGKKSVNRYKGGTWIKPDELDNTIDLNFINNNYKPKRIMVEKNNLDNFSINDGRVIPLLVYQAHDDATKYINSQLYTKYNVCNLKKQYEIENKIIYDIVILTRFDFGFEHVNLKDILNLDMSRIYFPGYNSHHAHPGKGGGCLSCDNGNYHFGCSHSNDMCDVWAISCSNNINLVGNLYEFGRSILRDTRYVSYDYIMKNNIKHKKDKNFIYVYEKFEDEKLVCYYPERLLREYLKNNICLTYNGIHGRINVVTN